MADTIRTAKEALSVVPANAARWEDLQAVLGTRGDTYRCQCQRYKMRPGEACASFPVEERSAYPRLRSKCRALARPAVYFARERGARALEGYPMLTEPGKEITWGELHVGSRGIFAAAG